MWSLTSGSADALTGVEVQRAKSWDGPFRVRAVLPRPLENQTTYIDYAVRSSEAYWYRLALVSGDSKPILVGPVATIAMGDSRLRTELLAPYEPRVGGSVRIRYSVEALWAPATLAIYDVRGRLVRLLDQGMREIGEHVAEWDRLDASGRRAKRGVYFLHLESGSQSATRKFVMVND